ncbi:G-protein coupled receptor 15-like [Mustelus asterias]
MAVADLMIIINDVILRQINYHYFSGSFLDITPVCSVLYATTRVSIDCSVWFTIAFSFDRFVAICCQKLKDKYCTKKTAGIIIATGSVLFCAKNVPLYFTNEPYEIINNVPFYCAAKTSYYTEPGWIGYDWFDMILNPMLPFALILFINTLTVRHILVASQVRKSLTGQRKGENNVDPEMESRRRSMILLFTISGSFITLWMTYVIYFLYYRITGTNPTGYSSPLSIAGSVGAMLLDLSCCTNTFIYGVTQSKFREQFVNVVKYPCTLITKISNEQVKLS